MSSTAAISDAYLAHRHRLEGLARRIVGCPQAAADLAQDAWTHAADAIGPIRNPASFLHRVTRNLALDLRRRRSRDPLLPLDAAAEVEKADPFPGPERAIAGRQVLAKVERAIADLPPRCREAFLLARLDGLSHGEVAARMGVSPRTVENHVAFAMVRLRSAARSDR